MHVFNTCYLYLTNIFWMGKSTFFLSKRLVLAIFGVQDFPYESAESLPQTLSSIKLVSGALILPLFTGRHSRRTG